METNGNLRVLLLRDLCGRLPYRLQVKTEGDNEPYTLLSVHPNKDIALIGIDMDGIYATSKVKIGTIKPYLRPMSSMTEEESDEFQQLDTECDKMPTFDYVSIEHYRIFDWLNAYHFDYHGLIEKGLAIAVTEENNPYKE